MPPSPLPLELYSLIFESATFVPEALDTSFDIINSKTYNIEAIARQIWESNCTKVAISTCSKSFHAIVDRILYSTILLCDVLKIPNLLPLLRTTSSYSPSGRPRGHTCRRLDLYIHNMCFRYKDLQSLLQEGGHTLFGLLPACPYLEILIMHITYPDGMTNPPRNYAHPVSLELCKAISTFCYKLRRLELYGLSIRMDRLERLLRHLPNIEVCSLYDIVPLRARHFFTYRNPPRQWKRKKYRLEVNTDASWTYKYEQTRPLPSLDGYRSSKMDEFGNELLEEFRHSKRNLTWPPTPSAKKGAPDPCILPKLHTLQAHCFNDQFFEMQLPACKSLKISSGVYDRIIFNTNLIYTATLPKTPSQGGHDNNNNLNMGGNTHYNNPVPHSTPFGLFPSTITHLQINLDIYMGLSRIFYFFPNLTDLTWKKPSAEPDSTPFWPGTSNSPPKPYTTLRRICLVDSYLRDPKALKTLMRQILPAIHDGVLLGLEEIELANIAVQEAEIPLEECERLGVKLTVVPRPKFSSSR